MFNSVIGSIPSLLLMATILLGPVSAYAENTCENIVTFAGKLGVFANGQVTLNGKKLETESDPDVPGVESATVVSQIKLGDRSPTATGVIEFTIARNNKFQPVQVKAMVKGQMNPYLNPYVTSQADFARQQPSMIERTNFEYTKDGACALKRKQVNSTIYYDRDLCEKLSGYFDKFSKLELSKSSKIVGKMSTAIEKFKKSIKEEGLTLAEGLTKNTNVDSIVLSAECNRSTSVSTRSPASEPRVVLIPKHKSASAAD